MKRFWICILLMVLVFSGALVNSWYLAQKADGMTDLLQKAQTKAEDGDWELAQELTAQAQQHWEDSTYYLYVILHHSEADEVQTGFQEVMQLLRWQEEAEYTSANARLISNIQLLAEMEQFTLKNLL